MFVTMSKEARDSARTPPMRTKDVQMKEVMQTVRDGYQSYPAGQISPGGTQPSSL